MYTLHLKPAKLNVIILLFIKKSIEKFLSFKRFYVKTDIILSLPNDYVHMTFYVTYTLTENLDFSKINIKFERMFKPGEGHCSYLPPGYTLANTYDRVLC